jgi:hypothetical protein
MAVTALLSLSPGKNASAASPIAFEPSSYNVDMVYENVAIGSYSVVTGTQDDDTPGHTGGEIVSGGDDRAWPEDGLVVQGVVSHGLPSNGVITAGETTWQLKSYTGNNAMQLRNYMAGWPVYPLSATMTLMPEARVPYGEIDVLQAGAHVIHQEGPMELVYGVVLTFTDGTSADLGQNFILPTWDSSDLTNLAFTSERIATYGSNPSPFPRYLKAGYDDGRVWPGVWNIYHRKFNLAELGLNQKALFSITFTNYTGANYTALAVSGVAPVPTLSLRRVDSEAELSWDRGTLQGSESPAGPWNDLISAVSPWRASLSGPTRFFRLRN